jgi:hypothetical protein
MKLLQQLLLFVIVLITIQDSTLYSSDAFIVSTQLPSTTTNIQSFGTTLYATKRNIQNDNDPMKQVSAATFLAGTTILSSVVILPTTSVYAAVATVEPVTVTKTTIVKPAISTKSTTTTITTTASIPGPKMNLDSAKATLVTISEQRTKAITDVRATKSSADKVITQYNTAKTTTEQSKKSYINANDRFVSMKNVKNKDSISTKSIQDQQRKVGTFI